MSSSEFTETILSMMENQDRYFNIFLTILGIVLVFAGVIQWRLSSKQIEEIKEKTKKETITEIENLLEVSNLIEFKNDIHNRLESYDSDVSLITNDIEKRRNKFEYNLLGYELIQLHNKEHFLVNIVYLIDIFDEYLSSSLGDFNYFVSRVESLISIRYREKSLNIQLNDIDVIIEKMDKIESSFNERSEKLKQFKNHLKLYRSETK